MANYLTRELLDELKKKPVKFFKKILGIDTIERYQQRIINLIYEHDFLCIRSTHSVGKTFLMARIGLWFLCCFKDSKVITSAPTYRQVVKLLWGELRQAHATSKYPLGGKPMTNELKIDENWYAMGFSPRAEAGGGESGQKGSTFQGFHARFILIIFDEATGMAPDMWKMVEGLLTSGEVVKFVAIGNPTSRNTPFFKCFSDPEWKKVQISCFDSPNLIANDFIDKASLRKEIEHLRTLTDKYRLARIKNYKKPVPYLLSAQWVVSRVYKWGFNHPLTKTKVFGEFPDEDDYVIVQQNQVENAIAREYHIKENDYRCIGVDVARFGPDLTVLTELIGKKMTRKAARPKGGVDNTINEVMSFIIQTDMKTYVLVDGTGVGGGVVDGLKEKKRLGLLNKNVHIIEVNFAQSCYSKRDQKHYTNLKGKIFFELGEDLEKELDILNENVYLEELPSIRYEFDGKGKIKIESKDKYKERTGNSSPDHSDSLAIANYGRKITATQLMEEDKKNEKTTHAETYARDQYSDDDKPMAPSPDDEIW